MKLKYIPLALVLLFGTVLSVNAQVSLSPSVTPAQGGNYVSGGVDLSWTMGETFTPTLTAGGTILSQGFEQPEVQIYDVTASTTACAGAQTNISFSTSGFVDASNVFTAYLSDASGSFTSAVSIGTVTSTSASATISANIPVGTTAGAGYKIRVSGSAPVFTSRIIAITIYPIPVFTATAVNVTCNGLNNGRINVSVSAGASPFAYSINNGTTYPYSASPITGLSPNTYNVLVRDNNSCVAAASQPVAITQPNALSVAAGNDGPYIVGQTINLSSTPSGGSTPYGYGWSGPQPFSPNNVANPTINNATLGMTGNYTVVVTDANGCTASDVTAVTVNTTTDYTWTGGAPGNTNGDWNVATNWSPNGIPNSCSNNVTIPVTVLRPSIVSPISVGNVIMNAGAQMSLNANMNVCGNWTGGTSSNAIVGGTTGLVTFNGSTTHIIAGKTSFIELKLNNTNGGITMSGAVVDIYTALDLQKGNFNTTGGTLTFKSISSTHCGIIDNFSYGATPGTITGTIYAERYYDASSAYVNQHFMGSPVNNMPLSQFGASGTAGFVTPNANCDEQHLAQSSVYGTVFSYHEDNGAVCGTAQWKVEVSGNAGNGVGYSVARNGAGTLTVNGTPNLNSSYTVPGLVNSGWPLHFSLQGHSQTAGWQLVSNPYLAPLEIKTSNSDIDGQVQLWNANGPFAGTYQAGMVQPNSSTTAFIAPFQAFMIHKTSTSGTTGFTINAADRVRTLHTFYSQNANELKIMAENTATHLLDQTTVAFNPAATSQFDVQYDANKFPGNLDRHTLYTQVNNTWMGINTLHTINETGAVPMGFEAGKTGSYTFTFDGINTFDPSSYIMLEDKQANIMYNVRTGPYNFTADSADNWNRFVLHFTPPVEITAIDAGCNTQGSINIAQPGTAQWNYTLTDDNGSAIISSGNIDQNNPVYLTANAGSYTLSLVDNTTGYTVVKPIQVNGTQAASASFTVSASTVAENNEVVVQATPAGAANYQWNFGNGITATGQSVTTSYLTAGIYNVVLVTTNQYGCSATATQTITVTHNATTGIGNVAANKNIEIWSSENKLYIDFTMLQKVNATISVFNVLGQQIYNDKFTNNTVYVKEIDNMETAYLMVRVKEGDKITAKKVLINNIK